MKTRYNILKGRKKYFGILLLLAMFLAIPKTNAQKISPYLVGNNVWMNPSDGIWNYGAQCHLQMIRIGGEAYDGSVSGATGSWIQKIIAMGAEPLLQVPQAYSAAQAADLVRQFPNVKYWNIGNEPGLQGQGVAVISAMIKRDAPAMRDVNPNIKIYVADECDLWYGGRYYEQLFSTTGGQYDVSGKDSKGRWMIDGISWHRYAGVADITSDIATRIVDARNLANAVSAAKGRTGDAALGVGIGEYNHDGGAGVHTFINGQAFGSILGLCMKYSYTYACTWSMFENGGSRTGTDFSYIDGPTGKPRATYYHMQMVAMNFSGDYADGTINQSNVVAYGCKDVAQNKLCAMIINKSGTAYSFGLRFDNTAITSGTLHVNLNAGVSGIYTDNIPANSTICLVFTATGSKRILYTSGNFSAAQAPTTTTITNPFIIGDNIPPTVTLTAPANNTTIEVNTPITVSAIANDADGTVSKVDFYAGSTLIGTDDTSPYSISWTPTTAGTYAITAQATDNEGASTPSDAASLIVSTVVVYIPIPGRIEAEAFTTQTGIQTQPTTDVGGGANIGYSEPGDHLEYLVKVNAGGTFKASFRVASLNNTGAIELRNGAGTKLTSLALNPGTGDWQTWVTKDAATNFTLDAGNQTIQVYYTGAGLNINWFDILSVEPQVLTSIEVKPSPATVVFNQNQQFTATGKDQHGVVMDIVPAPTWSQTGGTISTSGLYTAGSTAGTFNVSAQSGSIVGNAQVIIVDVPPLGKIEAEAYTAMFGIQTQATTDAGGGLNIGYVDVGDWLDYAITVPTAGAYNVSFRVASQLATGAFQLKKGTTVLASLAVPNTGGWQNWQTISAKVTLAQGAQTLRIQATGAGLNINWINFEVAKPSIKIEAESYSAMLGIQTEATTDAGGGLDVGWTEPGDWMDYQVTIPAADLYTIDFRVASQVATGKIELRNQAGTALASLTQGSTGGWQTWTTKSVTANLPAGLQTLRIYYIGAGLNINWFEITQGLKSAGELTAETNGFKVYPNPATDMITVETNGSDFNILEVRSISGALILTQPISASVTEINIGELKEGMYLVTLKDISTVYTQKLIVK
jgi:hypothetical protein